MKRQGLMRLAMAGALLATATASAQEKEPKLIPGDLTGTVTFATDYAFRGISQTDGGPAIQGAIDYAYMFRPEIGVYAGIFGSNVDFDDGDEANMELDLYAGLKGEVSGVLWQAGVIHYAYPGAEVADTKYDYTEVAGKLGYDFGFLSATAGVNYSNDYFFESGEAVYVSGDVSVPLSFLPFGIGLLGHVGHQWIEENSTFGAPDYLDWLVGISGKVEGFTLSLQYVDTDIGDDECFSGGLTGTCDERVIFAASRTF